MEYHERRINVATIAAILLSRAAKDVKLPSVLMNDNPDEIESFDDEVWPYLPENGEHSARQCCA